MIEIAALLLSASAITVDPAQVCTSAYTSGAYLERYKHCQKGDLIQVGTWGYKHLCDLKSGVSAIGGKRATPYICIHRGTPRKERVSSRSVKAAEDRKKVKDERKASGRKKL